MVILTGTPDVDSMLLSALRDRLQEALGIRVELGAPMEDISYAFNPQRNQYYAAPILDWLKQEGPGAGTGANVLGVVEVDLYAPELNFVFGEADLRSGVAVVSLARLRQSFYGLQHDEDLFFERALKEAIHELGHTVGLLHCPDKTCVMHFSNCLDEADRKSREFCEACTEKWQAAVEGD